MVGERADILIPPAGFRTRPATVDDAQITTDLLNADALAKIGLEPFSLQECLTEWSIPGFDLARSSEMVFAADGRLAAYVEVWDTGEAPQSAFVLGATQPEFTGLGLGTFLLQWAERRARWRARGLPNAGRFTMQLALPAGHQPSLSLAASFGLQYLRTFYTMRLDFDGPRPEPVLPDGLALQTLEEFGDPWLIYQTIDIAFQDHFNYEVKSEAEMRKNLDHKLNDPAFDPSLWLIAHYQGDIAGGLIGYPLADENPAVAFVNQLGVLRPFRRRGIAQALLARSFAIFSRRPQFEAVQLNVDADSKTGANRLYLNAGMRVLRETELHEKVVFEGE